MKQNHFVKIKRYFIFILFLICSQTLSGQNKKLSDISKISIITCGSGDELYSIYGHTAIRVKDAVNNLDLVFNYGYFDFNTPNFYLKFVKGDMQYFGAVDTFDSFIYEYQITNRSVFEQQLLLSNKDKQQLFDNLIASVAFENKFYTYKFINKNCTTMVLDKINVFYENKVKNKDLEKNSYRTVLFQYLENHFWENLGINIIFGSKVDQIASRLFLPNQLMKEIEAVKINGKSIANHPIILNKKIETFKEFSFINSVFPLFLFLIILILLNKKTVYLVYFSIMGFLGLFFSFVGFYSFHEEIWYNYNMLLFNPLLFLLVYFVKKNKTINTQIVVYLNVLCLLTYIFILLNKVHILMVLPLVLANILIFIRLKLLSPIK